MNSDIIIVTEKSAAPTTASSCDAVGLRRDEIVFEEPPEEVPGERGVNAPRRHGAA